MAIGACRANPRHGAKWLGVPCLMYVNWVARRNPTSFIHLSTPLAAFTPPAGPSGAEMHDLSSRGGISELLRLFNTAYVGAPDYRKAGWVQAMALQACRGFDPSLIWIAYEGSEAVGFCMARQSGDRGRITGLGVTPHWRRNGIGARLLQHAMGELKRRGSRAVDLSVAPGNDGCLRIVRGLGFTEA